MNSTLVSPLTKVNQKSLNFYHDLGPLGIHSSNQEYIGSIKYHIFLARKYLGLVPSACSILPPPLTVQQVWCIISPLYWDLWSCPCQLLHMYPWDPAQIWLCLLYYRTRVLHIVLPYPEKSSTVPSWYGFQWLFQVWLQLTALHLWNSLELYFQVDFYS